MLDILDLELRSIIKGKDANDTVFVKNKSFSNAAVVRVLYWLKKLLTYFTKKRPNYVLNDPITIPKRMKSLIHNYSFLDDNLAQVAYFIFKRQIIFTLENYSPKQKNRDALTALNIDQAIHDRHSAFYPYLYYLEVTISLPEHE